MKSESDLSYAVGKITNAEYYLCTGMGPIRERFSKAYQELIPAMVMHVDVFEDEFKKIKEHLGNLCGPNMAGVADEELQKAAISILKLAGIICELRRDASSERAIG